MFRRIRIRAESANFYRYTGHRFSRNIRDKLCHIQSVAVLLVVGPAGCSKSLDFLPTQPWLLFHPPALSLPRQTLCPGTRHAPSKTATSTFLSCAFREQEERSACSLAGCSERPSSKAAGESKPEAYPQGYVEDFDEPRTKLADFINSLLD
jgi:hypothetical protein